MTTLTPSEAVILRQLREKPMRVEHINFEAYENKSTLELWGSWGFFLQNKLIRSVRYVQEWRTVGLSDSIHLTYEGRLALIAYEKE